MALALGSGTQAAAWGWPARPSAWTTGLALVWLGLLAWAVQMTLAQPGGTPSTRTGEPALQHALIAVTLLVRGVLGPLCEEILFRGGLFLTLRRLLGPCWAVPLAALGFALAHHNGGLQQMTVALVLGLLLTAVFERSESLPRVVLLHSSLNLGRLVLALARGHL